jgi:hypothetical protein
LTLLLRQILFISDSEWWEIIPALPVGMGLDLDTNFSGSPMNCRTIHSDQVRAMNQHTLLDICLSALNLEISILVSIPRIELFCCMKMK